MVINYFKARLKTIEIVLIVLYSPEGVAWMTFNEGLLTRGCCRDYVLMRIYSPEGVAGMTF